MEIAPEAIQGLAGYNFPSNISELKKHYPAGVHPGTRNDDKTIRPAPPSLSAMNDVQDGSNSYILSDAIARTEKSLVLKAFA